MNNYGPGYLFSYQKQAVKPVLVNYIRHLVFWHPWWNEAGKCFGIYLTSVWNVLLLKQMPKLFFKRFLFFADGTNSNVNPGKIKTITVGSLKSERPSLSRLLTPGIQINSDRRQKYPQKLNKARWSPLIKLVKEWVAKSPKNIVYICRFVPYILMVCRYFAKRRGVL